MPRAVRAVAAAVALSALALSVTSTATSAPRSSTDDATATLASHADRTVDQQRPTSRDARHVPDRTARGGDQDGTRGSDQGRTREDSLGGTHAQSPARYHDADLRAAADQARDPADDPADDRAAAPTGVDRDVAASIGSEGYLIAEGTSEAGQGSEVTYTVEREAGVDVALADLVMTVEEALGDPRSWANDHTLRRVADPEAARIRVLLATPDTVDELCAQAGLSTNGRFSCWNGTFAALNADRWTDGAWSFGDDLAGYRRYLVNHEFGHGLGYGHVDCPGTGQVAPLMMQQTRETDGCIPNGWPYPHLGGTD